MFISDLAIRKPIVTIAAMLALAAFGVLALAILTTDEFPDVQQPVIAVTIVYPGASPAVVEREVVVPVEDALFSISGIDATRTTSSATDGLAQLTVFFDYSKNIQQASQDIRDAISSKRSELPQEMEEPILTRFDPSDMPIVSLILSGPAGVPALTALADPTIASELRAVPGVAQVSVVGGLVRELTVQMIPEQLRATGLSVAEVVAGLQTQNLAAPVGRLEEHLSERTIRLRGRLDTPEQFANMVVAQRGGRGIRLGEVARVFDGTEDPRTMALFNGQRAVGLEIIKAKGYSTTQVASAIRERVDRLSGTLPAGAKLEVVRDSGVRVARAVLNVQESLFEGALLTVLVVFFFLASWRSTVITGLALPVSALAAFISVWVFGFTLNTMSLLGLSLAIGILIDDAIVVRENIVRHVQLGYDHVQAAHVGTNQIGRAVAATTFSIVAVFFPVAFMGGVAGQWFKPFALAIACAVLVSLFVSFSLDPMLSAYWFDPQLAKGSKRGRFSRALVAFNRWFDRQADSYRGVIGWALDHRVTMVALGILSLVGAIALQLFLGGAGFAPVSDRSEISVVVEAPPGSSLEYTRRKVEQASQIVRAHSEVLYSYDTIGVPIPLKAPGVDQALMYVRLKPKAERKLSQDKLGELLRLELSTLGGATTSVYTGFFGGAFPQIQIEIRGSEISSLEKFAARAAEEVKKVPGAVDVGLSTRGERPEVEVSLNRGLAGSLGVTVAQLAQAMRPAFAGLHAGDWVDPSGETRKVMVRLAPEARSSVESLRQLPLSVAAGPDRAPGVVPLGQVATVSQAAAPAQINHLGRDKVIDVQANVQGRSLSEVNRGINEKLSGLTLPAGVRITQGGETRDEQEIFRRIFVALAVAVLLMYLILVIQFGSFLDPIAILLSLPLSLVGVVLALLITGDTLNIMSLIGVMLLMGIVAKNAILLIDYAKMRRQQGMPRREALIEAGRVRLRPIMMTTVAIIAGMIPVAIGAGEGGDFRAPLGRAVIGGVITSTLLTLLLIPTVYEILDGGRERAVGWLRRRLGRARGAVPEAGQIEA